MNFYAPNNSLLTNMFLGGHPSTPSSVIEQKGFQTPKRGTGLPFPTTPDTGGTKCSSVGTYSPLTSPPSSDPIQPRSSPSREQFPWNWHESRAPLTSSPSSHIARYSSPESRLLSPESRLLELTPDRSFQSPERHSSALNNKNNLQDSGKRGRPRADVISHLMQEGSSSPCGIKCKVCHRVFPREKSLQAHLRTHTGERPYTCDYPGCTRAFTQSGQLKTHQRLHAGEKPFVCSAQGCNNRYTHANRTCPIHPYNKPQRSNDLVLQPVLSHSENNSEVIKWLENYRRDRQEKSATTPGGGGGGVTTPCKSAPVGNNENDENASLKKSPKSKRGLALEQENYPSPQKRQNFMRDSSSNIILDNRSILESRLIFSTPRKTLSDITLTNSASNNSINLTTPKQLPSSSHEEVSPKQEVSPKLEVASSPQPEVRTSSSPYSPPSPSSSPTSVSLNPKKRWLKEVFQEAEQKQPLSLVETPMTSSEELLAKPIKWTEEEEKEQIPFRRSPKSWAGATALVELGESKFDQPLNLSLSNHSSARL